MDFFRNNKVLVILGFVAMLSLVVASASIYYLLNIKQYIYPELYFMSPYSSGIASYETYQELYMYVEDVEIATAGGKTIQTIKLKTVDDPKNQRSIVFTLEGSEIESYQKNWFYWDSKTEQMYNYYSLPEEISHDLEPSNVVLVRYQVSNTPTSTSTTTIIKTVTK